VWCGGVGVVRKDREIPDRGITGCAPPSGLPPSPPPERIGGEGEGRVGRRPRVIFSYNLHIAKAISLSYPSGQREKRGI